MITIERLLCEIGIHQGVDQKSSKRESWVWTDRAGRHVVIQDVYQRVCCNCGRIRLHIKRT